jgi:penicillin-binding protein 1A
VLTAKIVNQLRRSRPFRSGLGISFALSCGLLVFLTLKWQKINSNLPTDVINLVNYARPNTLTIKAEDGSILAQFGDLAYETVPLSAIPLKLQQAFIAIEDSRFYQHQGIDLQGIARASVVNLKSGKVVEGGSTITQQLARIAYLDQDRSWERKIKEVVLAQRINYQLTKEQILATYLNLVYLGSGAYGVADAAHRYFGKSLAELTLPEMATLAGITPAPSLYSPLENPEAAKTRRDLVLARMEEQGYISNTIAQQAMAIPLVTQAHPLKRQQRQANYFVEYIQQEIPKYVSQQQLEKGGIVVHTTLNPQWQTIAENTVNDAIDKYGKWQKFSQGALVAVDPRNGEIKTMVGGTDFEANQFNRVTQAQRQPGSTFKTFVYATAIAGGFSPYKTYLDSPFIVDGYEPKNYNDKYKGTVPIYQALTSSLNVVAVKNLIDVGWNPIIEVAQKMGIKSELKPTYSLALGASEVNLLELTSAYGTLANHGNYYSPHGIKTIVDGQGNIIYATTNFNPEIALDEDSANITTWMLQKVVLSGTGIPAQIGRPVAGKTGTSDDSRDLWFIGYIPQLVTGIWLGNDDNQETWGSSAITAQMWRTFMLEATKDLPIENFSQPPQKLVVKEKTIELEPLKPKKSYHTQIIQTSSSTPTSRSSRSRRAYSRRRPTYSAPRRVVRRKSTVTNTQPVSKPPTSEPVTQTITPPPPQLNKTSKSKGEN